MRSKKLTRILIISTVGALVVGACVTVAIIFGQMEALYQKGVKALVNYEYQEATNCFADPLISNYKDSPKKYQYSYTLLAYSNGEDSYEKLIDTSIVPKGNTIVNYDVRGGQSIQADEFNEKHEKYVTQIAYKHNYDFVNWSLSRFNYNQKKDSLDMTLLAN